MPKSTLSTNLLTVREQQKLYGLPTWSAKQQTEVFTLTPDELEAIKHYDPDASIYFIIKLTLFKLRQTLVNITEEDTQKCISHLQKRYFPDTLGQTIYFPSLARTQIRIENKILELCRYQRCRGQVLAHVKKRLAEVAARYPRQRALCKSALDICRFEKIALPALSTLEDIVSTTWQAEQQRVYRAYHRYTTKADRNAILALLDKRDKHYRIVHLRQEMKNFTTTEIENVLRQQDELFPLFQIATTVIPKLNIPKMTVDYYASLVDYYKGTRLLNLESMAVQLYLLCYVFNRFQMLNDTVLEALKKRAQGYYTQGKKVMRDNAATHLTTIEDARKNVSEMLLAIKRSTHKTHVPKATLFRYVPEDELVATAALLADEKLDPEHLFWEEIDQKERSIALNLRPLFLALALAITNHEALASAADYLRTVLEAKDRESVAQNIPEAVIEWLSPAVHPFIIVDDAVVMNRLEFWIYYQLAEQIKTNKLTLKHTLKYKPVDEDKLPIKTWKKDKAKILRSLPYQGINKRPKQILTEAKATNQQLFKTVNHAILNNKNPNIIISTNPLGQQQWRLKPLQELEPPVEGLFTQFPKHSIVDVMRFVNHLLRFTDVFDSIVPRSAKHERDPNYILGAILGNALRAGTETMGDISDLNVHSLQSVEQACLRMETLTAALQLIYDSATQFPIFTEWNILSNFHGNLDGLKLAVQHNHHKARFSPKFFGYDEGVSSYNLLLNHFPLAGSIIGANEYEGHFAFELSQFQQRSGNMLEQLSTDKHGTNSLNFFLFYLTDILFAPRIPKVHNEKLWGFDSTSHYKDYIIQPTKIMNEGRFYDEWDNLQHSVASMLTGDTNASTIIRKLANPSYHSPTKLAFVQINQILKSNFILQYIHDSAFRHAIEQALNRGEAFNRLYRALTLLNKGELRGISEVDMMIWDACTRLLAAIILYYNSYILNWLYERTTDPQARAYLLRIVPTAWGHINLLGHYQFYGDQLLNMTEWLNAWRWQDNVSFG